MKESNYNYYVPYEHKVIFFNSLRKSLFVVSEQNAEKFKTIISEPSLFVEKYPTFITKMKEYGFVCDKDTDEYNMVMEQYRLMLWPHYYRLMILPTFRCNLSCWYCVQEHTKVDLTPEQVERIKLHLKKYLVKHDINNFYLTWFGGEPLLRYDIITDITSYAKKLCEELNISMNAGITTNSLLLTEKRIKELGNLNMNFFQITIDGNREAHNKVKHIPNVDTFERALNNIANIVRLIPNANVNLRINYSNKTLTPNEIIKEVNEFIPQELRHQIEIAPKKIWQEDERTIKEDKVFEMTDLIRESGYSLMATEYGICYVDYKHNTTIFPNGKIDICNLDNQEGRAELNENGDVVWPEVDLCFQQSVDKENILCNHCKHLPLCAGPCPVQRNFMIRETGHVQCLFNDQSTMEQRMASEIKKYYT